MSYQIKIELLTETLFGSGNAVPGYVDSDVQTDEYGMPFLKAKTLKGLVRENAELVSYNLGYGNELVEKLFGTETKAGKIRFSDAAFPERVRFAFRHFSEEEEIKKEDFTQAFTTEFSYTRLENGVAAAHSLRTIRMLNQGLQFEAQLDTEEKLTDKEETLLGCAVGLLKHVGTLKSKGKGCVRCRLVKDESYDATKECLQSIKKREDDKA